MLASTRGPASARTSSPRSMRQPAGSSMRPTSAVRRASACLGMTNTSTTRVADSEANSGASREKATSPRSTASWSRFSVGSSVLSSGSTSPLIAYLRLSPTVFAKPPQAQAASAGGPPSSISLRLAMPSTMSAMALRALAMSRGGAFAPELSSPSTRRRPRDGMDDRTVSRKSASVPLSAMTTMSIEARSNKKRPSAFGQSRQIVEREQHRFHNCRVFRTGLFERPHGVFRLRRIEAVDDARQARPPIDVAGRLWRLFQGASHRLFDEPRGKRRHVERRDQSAESRVAPIPRQRGDRPLSRRRIRASRGYRSPSSAAPPSGAR